MRRGLSIIFLGSISICMSAKGQPNQLLLEPHTYQSGALTPGLISLRDVRLSGIASLKNGQTQLITRAQILPGARVTIRDARSSVSIEGTIAGASESQQSFLSGTVEWDGTGVKSTHLSSVEIYIRDIHMKTHLMGGDLQVAPDAVMSLQSKSASAPLHPMNILGMQIPQATLLKPKVRWASVSFRDDLKVENLSVLMNMANGNLQPEDGAYSAAKCMSEKPISAVSDFIPNHQFAAALVNLTDLRIVLKNGQATINAKSAEINAPKLSYTRDNELPIAAAKRAIIEGPASHLTRIAADSISFSAPTGTVRIEPDEAAVVTSMNLFGDLDRANYLLPTGDSRAPYITREALYDFLSFVSASALADMESKSAQQISTMATSPFSADNPLIIEVKSNGIAAVAPSPAPALKDLIYREMQKQPEYKGVAFCVEMPEVGLEKMVGELSERWITSVFGSPNSAGFLMSFQVSRVAPALAGAAWKMGSASVRNFSKAASGATGMYLDHLSDVAWEKAPELYQKLSELKDRYLSEAWPATLRYDRRVQSNDYSAWSKQAAGRYAHEAEQRQIRSSEAEARNSANNQQLNAQTRARAEALRRAGIRAAQQGPPQVDAGGIVVGTQGCGKSQGKYEPTHDGEALCTTVVTH